MPKFRQPCPVPYAMCEAVGTELDRLESEGAIARATHSEWATPLVCVPKAEGKLRLCGDSKVTVNPQLQVESYPMPTLMELLHKMSGGKHFTKLDLASAYQQMRLDSESRKLVTITTHQGLYEVTQLPFGISSAPAIFQRYMDTLLQGLDKVVCRLDDILITGNSDKERLATLREVLRWLREAGIRLNRSKCKFFVDQLIFLGYLVSADGV